MKTSQMLIFALLSIPAQVSAQSAYIDKVYDFRPAPGQFVNTMPEWEEGDTEADMIAKADASLSGHAQGMISLGGYGGYVVFGFDHTIVNAPGRYDFTVQGNAIYASGNPNPDAPKEGGSAEPGIVMVSRDVNGNGLPDDEWYELAGSEFRKPSTVHGFEITYSRPAADHRVVKDPTNKMIVDAEHIAWRTNGDEAGFIPQISYHRQNYYPNWIAADEMTFRGTLLPRNAVDESGNGSFWVLYCYGYGYADNHPNADARSKFNIEWAVDAAGRHVNLDGIDFVKVYTGVNQCAGWLGETSTEVQDAWDLHIAGGDDEDVYYEPSESPSAIGGTKANAVRVRYFSLSGRELAAPHPCGVCVKKQEGKSILIFNK